MFDEKSKLTFKILFLLEDFREILRKSAPLHNFNETQKKKALDIIEEVEKSLLILKEKI